VPPRMNRVGMEVCMGWIVACLFIAGQAARDLPAIAACYIICPIETKKRVW
jgi:hypothetical protein